MADYRVSLRISVDGAGQARAELLGVAEAGQDMAGRLDQASQRATGSLGEVAQAGRRAGDDLHDGIRTGSDRAAAELRRLSDTARTVGATIAGAFALDQIGDGVRGLVTLAADYETALIGIQKTTDSSAAEMARIGEAIRREATTNLPLAAEKIAAIAEAAGTMGVRGKDNLLAYADAIAKLGTASDLQGAEAAQILGRIQSITRENPKTVHELAAGIVALGNAFATTEAEIAQNSLQIAQNLGTFRGITSKEIIALGAVSRELGQQAEIAGSALGRVARKLLIPDGAMAHFMGRTEQELQDFVRGDMGAALLEFLERLATEGPDAAAALDNLNLKGEELARTLPTLAANADKVRAAFTIAGDTEALEREFALFQQSLNSQATLLQNAFKDIGLEIGEGLTPVLTDAVRELRGVLADTESVISGIGTAAALVGGVLAARTLRAGSRVAGEGVETLRRQAGERAAARDELDRLRTERDRALTDADRATQAVRRAQAPLASSRELPERAQDLARARAALTGGAHDAEQAMRDVAESANRATGSFNEMDEAWKVSAQRLRAEGRGDATLRERNEAQTAVRPDVRAGVRRAPDELVDYAAQQRQRLAALDQQLAEQEARVRTLRRGTGLRGAIGRGAGEVSDFLGGPIGVGLTVGIIAYETLIKQVTAAEQATRSLMEAEQAYQQTAAATAQSAQALAAQYGQLTEAQRSFERDRLNKAIQETEEAQADLFKALRESASNLGDETISWFDWLFPEAGYADAKNRIEALAAQLRNFDAGAPDAPDALVRIKDEIVETARQAGVSERAIVDFAATFAEQADALLSVQRRLESANTGLQTLSGALSDVQARLEAAQQAAAQGAADAAQAQQDAAAAAAQAQQDAVSLTERASDAMVRAYEAVTGAAERAAAAVQKVTGGGTGGGGGWLSGSVYHGGGVVGAAGAPTRTLPAATWLGAPRLHTGGTIVGPGEVPAILERGEVVLTAGQARAVLDSLIEALGRGEAEAQAYGRALADVADDVDSLARRQLVIGDSADDTYEQATRAGRRWLDSARDQFASFEAMGRSALGSVQTAILRWSQTGRFDGMALAQGLTYDFQRWALTQGTDWALQTVTGQPYSGGRPITGALRAGGEVAGSLYQLGAFGGPLAVDAVGPGTAAAAGQSVAALGGTSGLNASAYSGGVAGATSGLAAAAPYISGAMALLQAGQMFRGGNVAGGVGTLGGAAAGGLAGFALAAPLAVAGPVGIAAGIGLGALLGGKLGGMFGGKASRAPGQATLGVVDLAGAYVADLNAAKEATDAARAASEQFAHSLATIARQINKTTNVVGQIGYDVGAYGANLFATNAAGGYAGPGGETVSNPADFAAAFGSGETVRLTGDASGGYQAVLVNFFSILPDLVTDASVELQGALEYLASEGFDAAADSALEEASALIQFAQNFSEYVDLMERGFTSLAGTIEGQAVESIESFASQLRDFYSSAQKIGQDERGLAAVQAYLEKIIDGVDPESMTDVEAQLHSLNVQYRELGPVLEEFGLSAEEAADGLARATAALGDQVESDLIQRIDGLTGGAMAEVGAALRQFDIDVTNLRVTSTDVSLAQEALTAKLDASGISAEQLRDAVGLLGDTSALGRSYVLAAAAAMDGLAAAAERSAAAVVDAAEKEAWLASVRADAERFAGRTAQIEATRKSLKSRLGLEELGSGLGGFSLPNWVSQTIAAFSAGPDGWQIRDHIAGLRNRLLNPYHDQQRSRLLRDAQNTSDAGTFEFIQRQYAAIAPLSREEMAQYLVGDMARSVAVNNANIQGMLDKYGEDFTRSLIGQELRDTRLDDLQHSVAVNPEPFLRGARTGNLRLEDVEAAISGLDLLVDTFLMTAEEYADAVEAVGDAYEYARAAAQTFASAQIKISDVLGEDVDQITRLRAVGVVEGAAPVLSSLQALEAAPEADRLAVLAAEFGRLTALAQEGALPLAEYATAVDLLTAAAQSAAAQEQALADLSLRALSAREALGEVSATDLEDARRAAAQARELAAAENEVVAAETRRVHALEDAAVAAARLAAQEQALADLSLRALSAREALGEVSATELEDARRAIAQARELAAAEDEVVAAELARVHALEDAAVAAARATAAEEARIGLLSRAYDALGRSLEAQLVRTDLAAAQERDAWQGSADGLALLGATQVAERADLIVQAARQDFLTAIDRDIAAAQEQAQAVRLNTEALDDMADGLRRAADDLRRSDPSLSPLAALAEITRQWEVALAAYQDPESDLAARRQAAADLQSLGGQWLPAAGAVYGTATEAYGRERDRVLGTLDSLAHDTEAGVSVDQAALRAAEEQLDSLEALRADALSLGERELNSLAVLEQTMRAGWDALEAALAAVEAAVQAIDIDIDLGAGANASTGSTAALEPGPGTLTLVDRHGRIQEVVAPAFATGAAFRNGIVARPTQFSLGLMGEAGPEGILPLAQVGSRLGVYARLPAANDDGDPSRDALLAEVRALRAEVAHLSAVVAETGAIGADHVAQAIRQGSDAEHRMVAHLRHERTRPRRAG